MTRDERPLHAVPVIVWGALIVALAAQLTWRAVQTPSTPQASDLPPAPSVQALRKLKTQSEGTDRLRSYADALP